MEDICSWGSIIVFGTLAVAFPLVNLSCALFVVILNWTYERLNYRRLWFVLFG